MIKKPFNAQTEGVHELLRLALTGMKLALFKIRNELFFQNYFPLHADKLKSLQ